MFEEENVDAARRNRPIPEARPESLDKPDSTSDIVVHPLQYTPAENPLVSSTHVSATSPTLDMSSATHGLLGNDDAEIVVDDGVRTVLKDNSIIEKDVVAINVASDNGGATCNEREIHALDYNPGIEENEMEKGVSNEKIAPSEGVKENKNNTVMSEISESLDERYFRSYVLLQDLGPKLKSSKRYCTKCRTLFPTRKVFATHDMSKHLSVAASEESVVRPRRSSEDAEYVCPECPSKFQLKWTLLRHLRFKHRRNAKKCLKLKMIGTPKAKNITTQIKVPAHVTTPKGPSTVGQKESQVDGHLCPICKCNCSSNEDLILHLCQHATGEIPKVAVPASGDAPKALVPSCGDAPEAPVYAGGDAPKAPVYAGGDAPKAPVYAGGDAPKAPVYAGGDAPKAPVYAGGDAPKAPVYAGGDAPKAPVYAGGDAPKAPVYAGGDTPKALVHKCDFCDVSFAQKKFLERHLWEHARSRLSNPPVSTLSVRALSKAQTQLRDHDSASSPGSRSPVASDARNTATTSRAINQRLLGSDDAAMLSGESATSLPSKPGSRTLSKKYKCPVCFQYFISTYRHMRHMWLVHKRRERTVPAPMRIAASDIVCRACAVTFTSVPSYNLHLRRQHVVYSCKVCRIEFKGQIALNTHKREHLNECYIPKKIGKKTYCVPARKLIKKTDPEDLKEENQIPQEYASTHQQHRESHPAATGNILPPKIASTATLHSGQDLSTSPARTFKKKYNLVQCNRCKHHMIKSNMSVTSHVSLGDACKKMENFSVCKFCGLTIVRRSLFGHRQQHMRREALAAWDFTIERVSGEEVPFDLKAVVRRLPRCESCRVVFKNQSASMKCDCNRAGTVGCELCDATFTAQAYAWHMTVLHGAKQITEPRTQPNSTQMIKPTLVRCHKCKTHVYAGPSTFMHCKTDCSKLQPRVCLQCGLTFADSALERHAREHGRSERPLTMSDFTVVSTLDRQPVRRELCPFPACRLCGARHVGSGDSEHGSVAACRRDPAVACATCELTFTAAAYPLHVGYFGCEISITNVADRAKLENTDNRIVIRHTWNPLKRKLKVPDGSKVKVLQKEYKCDFKTQLRDHDSASSSGSRSPVASDARNTATTSRAINQLLLGSDDAAMLSGESATSLPSKPGKPGSRTLSKKYKCPVCSQFFVNTYRYKKHMLLVHKRRERTVPAPMRIAASDIVCRACAVTFTSVPSYNLHLRRQHVVYSCKVCRIEIKGEFAFYAHMNAHFDERNIPKEIGKKTVPVPARKTSKKTDPEDSKEKIQIPHEYASTQQQHRESHPAATGNILTPKIASTATLHSGQDLSTSPALTSKKKYNLVQCNRCKHHMIKSNMSVTSHVSLGDACKKMENFSVCKFCGLTIVRRSLFGHRQQHMRREALAAWDFTIERVSGEEVPFDLKAVVRRLPRCESCRVVFKNQSASKKCDCNRAGTVGCELCDATFTAQAYAWHMTVLHGPKQITEPRTQSNNTQMIKPTLVRCHKCKTHVYAGPSTFMHCKTDCSKLQPRVCLQCGLTFADSALERHAREHGRSERPLTMSDFTVVSTLDRQPVRRELCPFPACRLCGARHVGSGDSEHGSVAACRRDPAVACATCELTFTAAAYPLHVGYFGCEISVTNVADKAKLENNDNRNVIRSTWNPLKIKLQVPDRGEAKVSQKLYKCGKCDIHFMTKQCATRHYWRPADHHIESKFRNRKICEGCGFKFTFRAWKRHFDKHHQQNDYVRSDYVVKTIGTIPKIQIPSLNPIERGIGPTLYRCAECETHFLKKWSAIQHSKKIGASHIASDRPVCSRCGLKFSFAALKDHFVMHHRLKNYKCSDFQIEVVGSTVRQEEDGRRARLAKIYASELSAASTTLYKCEECGLHFLRESSYQTHMSRHNTHALKPHPPQECDLCGLCFTPKTYLLHRTLFHDLTQRRRTDFTIVVKHGRDAVPISD